MKAKLTSRKFWVAIVSILVGILGVLGASDDTIQMVSSVALILIPGIIYIVTEGKIDSAAAGAVDMAALIAAIKKYLAAEESTEEETANAETISEEAVSDTSAVA